MILVHYKKITTKDCKIQLNKLYYLVYVPANYILAIVNAKV